MLIKKETIEKIKKIIQNNYRGLLITTAGRSVLTKEELAELEKAGYDTSDNTSLLSLIYYNNVLNELRSTQAPLTVPEMKTQQKSNPTERVHTAAEEHLNETYAQNVEKMSSDTQNKIEGIIREFNSLYRNKVLAEDIDESDPAMASLFRDSSIGGLKKAIREFVETADTDFERTAITETSNAMGLGSVARVVKQNAEKDFTEVYVYRIPVNDSALCKFCRKFYLDADQSPAVYRLSTILSNGSNYGKKSIDWKAVATATHPNDRESGIMELRPGWRVKADGGLDFIGQTAWKEYLAKKLRE